VDGYGRTPLHYAAADGNTEDAVKYLKAGANPNLQDDNGWSPLHFAAQAVSVDVTRALLEAGSDIELKDSYGNTPLLQAVFSSRGNGSVIKLLREAGANPHVANDSGVSPVSLARTIANYDVAQFFSDLP
jgi:ankyrin repeat protein